MARKTLTRQGSMVGVSPTLNCSTSEQVYDVVYVSGTDTVARTDASNASKVDAVGWIISKPTTTTCHISAQPGPVSGATGLVAGQPVYLSAVTPGAVTSTAPTIDVQVGSATSTTTWVFDKDLRATSLGDLTTDVTASDIDAGSRTISSVTSPSTADQAANKSYVDSVAGVTTGRLSMAGPIKSITVETATDTIDIIGISFDTDGEYEIIASFRSEYSGTTIYYIYAGDPTLDETNTNYDTARVNNVSLDNQDAPYVTENDAIGESGVVRMLVAQDVNGRLRVKCVNNKDTVPYNQEYAIRSVNAFGSITRLRFKADRANGFGVGSYVRVYRLGGSLSTGTSIMPLDVKRAADGFDDEFDSTSLNSSWTVVAGSAGTVNLKDTGAVAKYDLSTRPGWLLTQVKNGHVKLRKDYTLAVGESVVLCVSPGYVQSGTGDNSQLIGIGLNDNDTDYWQGNWFGIYAIDQDGAINFDVRANGSMTTSVDTGFSIAGTKAYLRIDREAATYRMWVSSDGTSWYEIISTTNVVCNNIWLWHSVDNSAVVAPIAAFDWIRLGNGNELDPWPLVDGSSVQPVAVGEWRGGKAHRTTAQNLPVVTAEPIIWTVAESDTDGFFDIGGTYPGRITIPAGVNRVRLVANVEILDVDLDVFVKIHKNGSFTYYGCPCTDNNTRNHDYLSSSTGVVPVVQGDYFEVIAFAEDAGSIGGSYYTWVSIEVVDPVVAITDKGSVNISSADSPYTMPTAKKTVYVTADGATTINLPALAGNDGMEVEVKILSGTSDVTLDPNSSETIEGASTYAFSGVGESRTFKAKAINGNLGWYLVSRASIEPGNLTPFTCTTTEAVGNLVYVSAASTVAQADADASGTSDVIGWIYYKPTTTTCLVADGLGPITASGLTAGAAVYLGGTAGGVSPTPGTIEVKVGVAVSATSFVFQRPLLAFPETAVPTVYTGDKALPVTGSITEDETYTGIDITETPYSDGYVQVVLDGLQVELGNGVKTKACFFSGDSGSTAKAISAITTGDGLYWNAVISGTALDSSDKFDLNYLVTAA